MKQGFWKLDLSSCHAINVMSTLLCCQGGEKRGNCKAKRRKAKMVEPISPVLPEYLAPVFLKWAVR
jgi:hypothetical protein